jgi:predicted ATPase/DNA-binding XRE family transcriptional regulator
VVYFGTRNWYIWGYSWGIYGGSIATEIVSIGEWIQSRRNAMGLTRADLARKVGCAEVTIKKIERDERRPSGQIAQLLAEHLLIPDIQREKFLQMCRGAYVAAPGQQANELRTPPYLQQGEFPSQEPYHFVKRNRELDQLKSYLEQIRRGDGLPVFILGDAGSGKTTLMAEFARQAQEWIPDLLVACGQCNAQSGAGDPYRPFRDILAMLTGDTDVGRIILGANRQQALRAWYAVPDMVRTINTYGSHLINLFLPAAPVVDRIAPYLAGPADWLERFQELSQHSDRSMLAQDLVLEEITEVLKTLSTHYPLLIILDDLQWVDDASKNLLYHLGRRLAGSRILLLGAYRLDEGNFGQPLGLNGISESNPLPPLVLELSRFYGEIMIDLNRIEPSEGRAFIDALIDSEPNHLDRSFRENLFRYTQGQPLFTVEMLRNMQENQSLVLDNLGAWTINKATMSYQLPARIEAVIAQRLEKLPKHLHELLNTASVEGDLFTVEIISAILGRNPNQALQYLSRELEGQYRLVQEQGEYRLGSHQLNRFRFRHKLFQEYLYEKLGGAEKRQLHRAIAEELERILLAVPERHQTTISGGLDVIGSAMVQHFLVSETFDKVAIYAFKMGKIARDRFAMREAITYFDQAIQALDRLAEENPGDEWHTQMYEAILSWVEAAYKFTPYEEQLSRLARAEAIARNTQDKERLIQVLHSTANVYLARGMWTRAGPALTECLELSEQLGNEQLSVQPVFFKALMTTFVDPGMSLDWINRALSLSRKYDDIKIKALSFALEGQVLAQLGDFDKSEEAIREAQDTASHLGSPLTDSDVNLLAAWACLSMGQPERALSLGQRSVEESIATDNMDCLCSGLVCIGYSNLDLQRIPDATAAFKEGITRSQVSGAITHKLNGQAGMSMAQFLSGKTEAIADLEQIVGEMHSCMNEVGAANANYLLGVCLSQIGDYQRAETFLNEAINYYRQANMRPYLAKALFSLSSLLENNDHHKEAQLRLTEADEVMRTIQ